jgi:hypothetical protein
MKYYPISIHSNQSFLSQWHNWIHAKAARRFKRDKERVFDTAQTARLRLLSKDFIGRWFFKHLTNELVDCSQAIRMLDINILYVDYALLAPVSGKRNSDISLDTTLWRVSDILQFAKFDHERYYYSPQNHTLDSDKVLRLLGYKPGQYNALRSMYRNGFNSKSHGMLLPSEFTEHNCYDHKTCQECERGRASLRARKISLAHDWEDPKVARAVAALRWNDTQLVPYLRWWRKTNRIKTTPEYIMRTNPNMTVDAGLLKYAEMVIEHEVFNDFKRLGKTDDLASMVLKDGTSPELSDESVTAYESPDSDSDGRPELVFRDTTSMIPFSTSEHVHDLSKLLKGCELSKEEADVLERVELGTMSVREYSNETGFPIPRVHRIRTSVIRKLRSAVIPDTSDYDDVAKDIAAKHGCTVANMMALDLRVGPGVVARSEFFAYLANHYNLTPDEIGSIYGFDVERVTSGIVRASMRCSP